MPVKMLHDALKVATIPCDRVGNSTSSLAYVLIVAEMSGRVTFSALSYDVRICVTLQGVDVIEAGSVFALGPVLRTCVGNLPASGVVQLAKQSAFRVRVECGRSFSDLQTMDPVEAPAVLSDDVAGLSRLVDVPAAILSRLLRVCLPFASTDQARPGLCAVNLEIGAAETVAVATDGTCMAKCSVEWGGAAVSLLLQREVAPIVLAAIDRTGADDVTILRSGVGDHELRIGDCTVHARPFAERFPDWRRVVPNLGGAGRRVTSAEFDRALARIGVIVDENHRVRFEFGAGELRLQSRDKTAQEASDFVACSGDGDDSPVCLDGSYVRRFLSLFNGDTVQLHAFGPMDPIVLVSAEDPAPLFVLSPMASGKTGG